MAVTRYLTPLLLALSLLFTACSDKSGQTAPNVEFTALDGSVFTTEDLRGKVVIVKFWATDCTTCVAQMPDTIARYQRFSDQGFDTIAVAMKHDPESYVRNFTKSRELPFTVAMDSDGNIAKAFGDVKMTPTTLLIDKKGNIIKRYLGNYDEEKLIATIKKALHA